MFSYEPDAIMKALGERSYIVDLCLNDRLNDPQLDLDYFIYECQFASAKSLDRIKEMVARDESGHPNPHNSVLLWVAGLSDVIDHKKRVDSVGGTPADIDMDFAEAGRFKIHRYLLELYGRNGVAKVGTIGTWGLKEIIKFYYGLQVGVPPKLSDYKDRKEEYEQALAAHDKKAASIAAIIKEVGDKLPKPEHGIAPDMEKLEEKTSIKDEYPDFYQFAKKAFGTRSRQGIHAGGLVLFDEEIRTYFPLYRGKKEEGEEAALAIEAVFDLSDGWLQQQDSTDTDAEEPAAASNPDEDEDEEDLSESPILVTQYDKDEVEKLGGLKIDLLLVDILDIISLALLMIEKDYPSEELLTMTSICATDPQPEVYEMLNSGMLQGVFQMETSDTAVGLFTRIKPTCISEISDINALNRPGPLDSGIVSHYIEGKKLGKPPPSMPPAIAEILRDTHYAMIYQEQVMRIFTDIAGMSAREADDVRRAMGKKDEKYLVKLRPKFIESCLSKKACTEEYANQLFDAMVKFASYAFNRSHAVGYSHMTYVTAWLKCFYPAQYFAAYLTIKAAKRTKKADQKQDQFQLKLTEIKRELDSISMEIAPPDINLSGLRFVASPDGSKILYSLSGIKRVSKNAVNEILKQRLKDGPFTSVEDFTSRVHKMKVNVASFKSLVMAGAFDSLDYDRLDLLSKADDIYKYHKAVHEYNGYLYKKKEAEAAGKKLRMKEREAPVYPTIASSRGSILSSEELKLQMEVIGCFLGKHPAASIKEAVTKIGQLTIDGVHRLGVVVSSHKEINTSGGAKMAFVKLEDDTGEIEAVCFDSAWRYCKSVIGSSTLFIAEVRMGKKKGTDKASYALNKLIPYEET
jgi:DNA polymerase-3 subunit alpha